MTITNLFATGTLLGMYLARKDAATPQVLAIIRQPVPLDGTTAAIAKWLSSVLTSPQIGLPVRFFRGLPIPPLHWLWVRNLPGSARDHFSFCPIWVIFRKWKILRPFKRP